MSLAPVCPAASCSVREQEGENRVEIGGVSNPKPGSSSSLSFGLWGGIGVFAVLPAVVAAPGALLLLPASVGEEGGKGFRRIKKTHTGCCS